MKHFLYILGGRSQVGKSITANEVAKRHGSLKVLRTDNHRPNGDDEVAWENITKLIESAQPTCDVLIEGVAIKPEGVSGLNVKNFTLKKAAFIGFTNPAYEEIIIAHANETWVGSEARGAGKSIREYVKGSTPHEIEESLKLKEGAEKFGYGYFDAAETPFGERVLAITDYLLDE